MIGKRKLISKKWIIEFQRERARQNPKIGQGTRAENNVVSREGHCGVIVTMESGKLSAKAREEGRVCDAADVGGVVQGENHKRVGWRV